MWHVVLGVMCGMWYPCCVQWVVVYMCDVYVVCTCSGEYVVGFMCGACYMWCVCAMVLYVMWCAVLWYVLYICQQQLQSHTHLAGYARTLMLGCRLGHKDSREAVPDPAAFPGTKREFLQALGCRQPDLPHSHAWDPLLCLLMLPALVISLGYAEQGV